jgi:hypothetical protein
MISLALWFCFKGAAYATGSKPLRVFVDCSGDDLVGERLCFARKEQIRISEGFKLVESQNSLTFEIHLISIDEAATAEDRGTSSSAAIVFTVERADDQTESFIDAYVASFGSDRVTEEAETILANFDKDTESYRSLIK